MNHAAPDLCYHDRRRPGQPGIRLLERAGGWWSRRQSRKRIVSLDDFEPEQLRGGRQPVNAGVQYDREGVAVNAVPGAQEPGYDYPFLALCLAIYFAVMVLVSFLIQPS